jgi:hypothetical protein
MKTFRPWSHWGAWAALGLGGSLGVALQDAGQPTTEMRVEELEKRVDELENYLKAQSKAAAALTVALDKSEKEGFTYGINPASREALLAGLRQSATAAQQKVPGVKEGGEKPAEGVGEQ